MLTLTQIDPKWKEHIVYEGKRNIPTIRSKALNALYGTVDGAKMFYDNFSKLLIDKLGLKRNEYDQCVVNKNINDQ